MKALIVGGGITGLATAVVLSRDGIHTTVVERRDQLEALGSGIGLSSPAVRALKAIGVLDACLEAGFGFTEFRFCDVEGRELHVIPQPQLAGPEWPSWIGLMRPKLHAILAQAATDAGARVRTGTTVVGLQTTGTAAEARFADGATETYDVIVGADGVHSSVRRLLFDGPAPTFEGSGCWRAVLPRPPAVDAEYVFEGHPMAHPGFNPDGPDLMHMFCVVPAADGWRPSRAEAAATMRGHLADFGGLVAQARDRITDPDLIDYRPLCSVLAPRPWHAGRVVLAGDAAHTATPHLASGGAIALEDAVVLGEQLKVAGADVPSALAQFTERRFERCRLVVESSSTLNHWQLHPETPGADRAALSAKALDVLAQPY